MHRFPLPALCACTACAALLVGCRSPVALDQPTAPRPPAQPTQPTLSFEISGPSRIDTSGPFSWGAFAFGGSGQYQYRCGVTRQGGQQPSATNERGLSLLVI